MSSRLPLSKPLRSTLVGATLGAVLLTAAPTWTLAAQDEAPVHPRRQQRLERLEQQRSGTSEEPGRRGYQRRERLAAAHHLLQVGLRRTTARSANPDKFSSVGGAFQVNTVTTGPQGIPDVARLPTGEFVVVWQSFYSSGDDADGISINGRVFAADGTPLSGEFQVNSTTADDQIYPSVDIAPNGFVVTWQSYSSSGDDVDGSSIQARRFAADGTPLGPDFQVNTYTTDYQYRPRVAVNGSGDFVIVWDSYGSPDDDNEFTSIQARRFTADGTPVGAQFQVNALTTGGQYAPDIALRSAGDFLVVWDSEDSAGSDGSSYSVQARRGFANNTFSGVDFQVNSVVLGAQFYARVDHSDSGFVVVWESESSIGTDANASIQGQRLTALGDFAGPQFQVNSDDDGYQFDADIAVTPAGDFAVSWTDGGDDGGIPLRLPSATKESAEMDKVDPLVPGLELRRFSAAGAPLGDEFVVSGSNPSFYGALAMDQVGNLVAVWEDLPAECCEGIPMALPAPTPMDDGSSSSTMAQLLQLDADLRITLVPQGAAAPGGTLIYLLTASNGGPDGVSVVQVTAMFDPALTCTWNSVASGGASGNGSGAGDIGELLNLPASAQVVYTITCSVDPDAVGDLTSSSAVSAAITELAPGDETAANVLPIAPQSNFIAEIPLLDARGLALLLLLLPTAGLFLLRR